MAYTNNGFCWHGLESQDTAKSLDFYPSVLGWNVSHMPMGEATATLFSVGEDARAHLDPAQEAASRWNNYLRVADVDATTALAKANGGSVLVEPTDIPPGRFSVIASPSGARLSLFHEANEADSTNPPGGVGAVHWVDLQTQSVAEDLAFLTAVFGFNITEMPMMNGGTYYVLNDGETPRAGLMQPPASDVPSHWLVWFEVDDADAVASRATQAGGQLLGDFIDNPNVGRMAVLADNTGATFGIIKPANP